MCCSKKDTLVCFGNTVVGDCTQISLYLLLTYFFY